MNFEDSYLTRNLQYANRLMYRYRHIFEGARCRSGKEKDALLPYRHDELGEGDYVYIYESNWGSTVFYFESAQEAEAARLAAEEARARSEDGYVPDTVMLEAAEQARMRKQE